MMTKTTETESLEPKKLLEEGKTTEAIELYEGLLARGSEHAADAAYSLGIIYHSGIGVSADRSKAQEYYTRAEQIGSDLATYRLGTLHYQQGDLNLALKYFERVAEANPSAAYWAYRIHLQDANGRAEAERYLKLAADQGHILAKRILAVSFLRGDHGIAKIPVGIAIYAGSIIDAAKALRQKNKLLYS